MMSFCVLSRIHVIKVKFYWLTAGKMCLKASLKSWLLFLINSQSLCKNFRVFTVRARRPPKSRLLGAHTTRPSPQTKQTITILNINSSIFTNNHSCRPTPPPTIQTPTSFTRSKPPRRSQKLILIKQVPSSKLSLIRGKSPAQPIRAPLQLLSH